jgi:hypothetical protein
MFKRRKAQVEIKPFSEHICSNLLPWVFEGFDEDESLQVLDVGVGCPSTVEFFAGFPSRVFFLDLVEEVRDHNCRDADSAERLFAQALEPYAGTLFDVCLFWELLHVLEAPLLAGLSNALRPYVYSRTKGYAVCELRADEPRIFRLLDRQTLRVLPGVTPIAECSLTQLAQQFNCFSLFNDCVSGDRLELLLLAD